jgi:RNA polymerase sigma factor (sigma-70 family)
VVSGFHFRYRLSGLPPSTRRLARREADALVPGDMVNVDAGVATLAATNDVALLGCVLEPVGEAHVVVIADDDAVYGVADPYRRRAGSNLDLTGGSGLQAVAGGPNDDFEVVVDRAADEETLLRITPGRHCTFVAAMPATELTATGARSTAVGERRLVMAAAAGDPAACAELVERFLPAIAAVAKLYRGAATVERAELVQEGVVGLLRALRRFDPSLGNPFWAYATWWVRQAMQQLVSELTRPTVLLDRAQRSLAQIRAARHAHLQAHGREPSPDALAGLVGLPREQVESLLAAEQAAQAIDGPAAGAEILVDPAAEAAYEAIVSQLEIDWIRDLTEGLAPRERTILVEHYGLEGPPRTLREIGLELGISAERVRQIEEQTLEKLRAAAAWPRIAGTAS